MHSAKERFILSLYPDISELYHTPHCTISLCRLGDSNKTAVKKIYTRPFETAAYTLLKNKRHPNLPQIYEIIEQQDAAIVIEEYINGETLAEKLDQKTRFTEAEIVPWLLQLCDVLGFLHSQTPPIIHRDIKPQNIIISNDGIVKLIDFDIARVYNSERNRDTRNLGTVGYAPPEQLGYAQTDCRSDIYAFGVLANELLCGKLPAEELYTGKLSAVIQKCVRLDIAQRYKSIFQVKRALQRTCISHKRRAAVLLAVCVLLLGASCFAWKLPTRITTLTDRTASIPPAPAALPEPKLAPSRPEISEPSAENPDPPASTPPMQRMDVPDTSAAQNKAPKAETDLTPEPVPDTPETPKQEQPESQERPIRYKDLKDWAYWSSNGIFGIENFQKELIEIIGHDDYQHLEYNIPRILYHQNYDKETNEFFGCSKESEEPDKPDQGCFYVNQYGDIYCAYTKDGAVWYGSNVPQHTQTIPPDHPVYNWVHSRNLPIKFKNS